MRDSERGIRMRLLSALSLGAILAGCAETTSIYHNRAMRPGTAITTDAYQRSVFVTQEPDENVPRQAGLSKPTQIRLCAEAAPDTFSALSASLAAEGDVVKKNASIAAAINQSGATIERTQTINLLRESMYRTCERYLSGAISKETLIVQAARDQRSMVAVLAIEQLTHVARPDSTVLSAGSTAVSLPNKALVDLVTDLRQEEKKADSAYTAAQSTYSKAEGAYTKAGGPADCGGDKPADADAPKQALWQGCTDAKKTMGDRQAELKTATDRVNTFATGDGDQGAASAARAAQGPTHNGGGGTPLSGDTIVAVADAVKEIANTQGIDETLMFCIAYVDEHVGEKDRAVMEGCINIMKGRALVDDQRASMMFSHSLVPASEIRDIARIAGEYDAFKTRLLILAANDADATIAKSIGNFEIHAGLQGISTGMAKLCKKKTSCIKAINRDGYRQIFDRHRAEMTKALDQW
ncbi:MAG: hypothetical protein ABI810_13200 [Sphingomonas bacterium]